MYERLGCQFFRTTKLEYNEDQTPLTNQDQL